MTTGNASHITYFILAGFFDSGYLKYCFFSLVLFVYIVIVLSNLLLIVVICTNRSLREPMYLLMCSLFVNELYGSASLFPYLMFQILSDIHHIPVPLCFLQVYSLFSYGNIELYTLAVMSYDRYLAICYPMHYHTRMTTKKLTGLMVFMWIYPSAVVVVMLSLSARLQLCGNIIDKVYCDNYTVVKLACSDTSVNNIYGLVYTFITIVGLCLLIVYTYTKILCICFSGTKQTREKAVSTCAPHLASLINFSCAVIFEIVQSRLDMRAWPRFIRIFLSTYFLTCQPLFNPLMYGLNVSKIRNICKSLLIRRLRGGVTGMM